MTDREQTDPVRWLIPRMHSIVQHFTRHREQDAWGQLISCRITMIDHFKKKVWNFYTKTPYYKKLSYRRGIARCVVSIEILPIGTQQCSNYLYDKS